MTPTVLVIEDDPGILRLECDILEDAGYRVLTALGLAAVAIAARERPACIVLDLMMPNTDGFVLREELLRRPQTAPIPVVVVSALPASQYRAANMQVHAIIPKPFNLDALVSAVAGAIPPEPQEE